MALVAESYAEAAVLGAVLQDPRRALEVRGWLRAEDFADPWRREIYRALVEGHLYSHPDVLSRPPHERTQALGYLVLHQLQRTAAVQGWQVSAEDWRHVAAYVGDLPRPGSVPNAAHAAGYARIVVQASHTRTVGARGEFAEQAVLAAVLARPDQAQQLRGWLRAEDFADPWMGHMYQALVEEGLASHPAVTSRPPGPERQQVLGRMLLEQLQYKAAERGWTISPAMWLEAAGQIRSGIRPVPHPEQAALIGQRVLQSSIQRQVDDSRWRVEFSLMSLGTPAAEMEVNSMLATLQELEGRWERAMGRPGAVGASLPPAAGRRPHLAGTEDAVLGSLMRDPGQVEQVRRWLRPQDFTAPGRAELYATITAAAEAGGTIDPVLIVWDAHRRSASPGALTSDEVWEIASAGVPGVAVGGGRELVEAGIVHHVRSAASAIEAAAGNPAAAPGMVFATARGHLQHASAQSARLAQANRHTAAPARSAV
ncbi:DnaB-like helicase N-terminal domain-containing protein [Kitasatospora sp. NPDC048540]|uniref:DnaB-like helicase N-terminal domain-containing protein n=1 Tax=Kitasatospora sp. NPDC048540 TaxID=3155634 RepID=UPI003407B1D7